MSNCCNSKLSMRREKFQQEGKLPSFSSSLLDEIYRSIDDSDRKQEKLSSTKKEKQSNNGGFSTKSRIDDEVFSFRKACLIESWMDKKVNEKTVTRRSYNSPGNDTLFFTPSTSCSDSSSGEFSSESEYFSGGKLLGSSCFAHSLPKPKPIRTSVSNKLPVTEKNRDALFYKNQSHINGNEVNDTPNTIKSKLRAMKIYKSLKKLKQPISPGLRLTTFLNSIFASKKLKEYQLNRSFDQMGIDKSTPKSTCSSASSFSRSCLSKSSSTGEKLGGNGCKKTVTFYLDSKFSSQKNVDRKNLIQIPTPICSKPLNRATVMKHEELSFRVMMEKNETQQKTNVSVNGDFCGNYENGVGDDDDDAMSDSSSDLFELDNLEFIDEKYKHCDELPVYETTRMFANRVIH